MKKINIGIIDDDVLVTELIKNFLEKQDDYQVLFTVHDGKECIDTIEKQGVLPEIVLLDLKMDGMNGLELTEALKRDYPSIKIIVVSSHYKKSFTGFMLKAGVSAFLPKGISPTQLVEVIKEVYNKGYYFMEDQLDALRDQIPKKSPKPILNNQNVLSKRELEILKLICQQKTAKEIGTKLFIAPRTVEGHKNNLFDKTGAKNIAGLVIYAIQNGIISMDELPNF